MPRLVTFIEDPLLQNLKKMSKDSKKSLSKLAAELIEIGYRAKQLQDGKSNKEEEKKAELAEKHTEYLLRILTILSDIYRCVRNEKSTQSGGKVDDVLNAIKDSVQAYISGYIGKD